MTTLKPKTVLIYKAANGKEPFKVWFEKLDLKSQARIEQRLLRVGLGNYGDFKQLEDGVSELRFHFGSGYRVYFGEKDDTIVLLLCGGDKKTQSKDIKKAQMLWKEFMETES